MKREHTALVLGLTWIRRTIGLESVIGSTFHSSCSIRRISRPSSVWSFCFSRARTARSSQTPIPSLDPQTDQLHKIWTWTWTLDQDLDLVQEQGQDIGLDLDQTKTICMPKARFRVYTLTKVRIGLITRPGPNSDPGTDLNPDSALNQDKDHGLHQGQNQDLCPHEGQKTK